MSKEPPSKLEAIKAWMNKQCYPKEVDVWLSNMRELHKILEPSEFTTICESLEIQENVNKDE